MAQRRQGGGVKDRPGDRLAGEGGRQHQGAPEGGGGARSPKRGAAELADVTSVPTPKAAAAMLVGEDEEALGEMAASVLQVDEAGQHCIRQNLHGEMDNAVEDITQRAVHATRRLDDTPILGHVGDQPLNTEGLGAPSDAHA